MDFQTCYNTFPMLLMEGALGERLKREYKIIFDDNVAMAGLIYKDYTRQAMFNIDKATVRRPVCYMVNCIHPVVLRKALSHPFNKTELVKEHFHGIQANASPLSPEELDSCKDLKCSDSVKLAGDMMDLYKYFTPKIFGGCCGTDNIHMEEIAKRLLLED